jgi:hypothetical protein
MIKTTSIDGSASASCSSSSLDFLMRRLSIFLVVSQMLVGFANAQAQLPSILVIRMSSQGSCRLLDLSIPCQGVGKKLRNLNIPLDQEIRIEGGRKVPQDVVGSILSGLSDAGYWKAAFSSLIRAKKA